MNVISVTPNIHNMVIWPHTSYVNMQECSVAVTSVTTKQHLEIYFGDILVWIKDIENSGAITS